MICGMISDLFEVKGRGKPPICCRRLMVNGMLYVVRGGIPWLNDRLYEYGNTLLDVGYPRAGKIFAIHFF